MMSVVAAAVGPAAAYGGGSTTSQLFGGSGARKRKDVVQDDQDAEAVESRGRGELEPRHHRGLFMLERVVEAVEEEERSSIGAASEDQEEAAGRDEEEGDQEADSADAAVAMRRSATRPDALSCMDDLDDALPVKRGLSNFFSGKSRSFADLQDAAATSCSARDLAKPENPFNKRRRVLRCCSIRRVASTPLAALPPFLPPAGDKSGATDDDDSG